MAPGRVLVLNPGSSSLKASLVEPPETTIARVESALVDDATRTADTAGAIDGVLAELGVGMGATPAPPIVGYRVVHGGPRLTSATLVDDGVVAAIEGVRDLAPLHADVALETIAAGRRRLPTATHVACFDTSFHASLPPAAVRYPVPDAWTERWGVRRYGFHGLSVEWSVRRTAALLERDAERLAIVVAHLGSGCSVTAVEGGRSLATSMGMTPLEGLMMGTRSGSVDPGMLLRLLADERLSVAAMADALEHGSGLAAVSGVGSDVRAIASAARDGSTRAELALSMFARSAAAAIAAAATALSRLDAIVFTGGIGAHATGVRRAIVARLGTLGVEPLDGPADDGGDDGDGVIGRWDAPVRLLRIEAREDLVIARQAAQLVAAPPTTTR